MIMIIAAIAILVWAGICRNIHLDLVTEINKRTGDLLIPRSFTMRFFTWGCAGILAVALASIARL